MSRLVNSDVTNIIEQVNEYKKIVQDAFYEHYKNIYKLSITNSFRGQGAEAYKDYIKVVSLNYINAFINITEEVSNTLDKMNNNFTSLEPYEKGSIDSESIKDIRKNLINKNKDFIELVSEIDTINEEASSYISVQSLNTQTITDGYSSIDGELSNINTELLDVDGNSLVEANNLFDRINDLILQLTNINNNYHADNKISTDKVNEITSEKWYKIESCTNLAIKIDEDPFFYAADENYAFEDQWAKGATSDVYVYAGYSNYGGAYKGNLNNRIASGSFNLYGVHLYENAQFTKYLKQDAAMSLIDIGAAGKAGLTGEYFGFEGKGNAVVADVNASAVLGSDEFNAYAKGSASALSANGYANCYLKDNGDFNIGLGGKASVADASGSIGTSLFTIPGNEQSKEYADGKVKVKNSTSLLELSVTGKVGVSASANFNISNTEVLDFGEVNIDVMHIKLGGSLGLGADVELSIPVITFDMPWED